MNIEGTKEETYEETSTGIPSPAALASICSM
jgi:hypothetical protein